MSDQLEREVDRQLSKYLTMQSGYMSIIFIVLIPFIKTMLLSDFSAAVPLQNIVSTIAFLFILVVANYKDKRQEHENASAALATPQTTEAFLKGMKKIAEGIKATQKEDIKAVVEECMRDMTIEPKIIEREVIKEVPVEKIVYVERSAEDVNETIPQEHKHSSGDTYPSPG